MTDLERAEQALKDAGFRNFGFSDPFADRVYVRDYNEEIGLGDDKAELYRGRFGNDDTFSLRIAGFAKDLPALFTAPALVQTLMDALKPFASLADQYAETWASFDFQDHEEAYMRIAVGHFLKALSTITAVETAKLPRMYTLEEILKQMGAVGEAVNDPNNGWTTEDKDAADQAFSMLMQRLEKPWKGRATT